MKRSDIKRSFQSVEPLNPKIERVVDLYIKSGYQQLRCIEAGLLCDMKTMEQSIAMSHQMVDEAKCLMDELLAESKDISSLDSTLYGIAVTLQLNEVIDIAQSNVEKLQEYNAKAFSGMTPYPYASA